MIIARYFKNKNMKWILYFNNGLRYKITIFTYPDNYLKGRSNKLHGLPTLALKSKRGHTCSVKKLNDSTVQSG